MVVINKSAEFTPEELYKMVLAPNGEKMTNHVGEVISCEKYVVYEDVDGNGEVRKVMSICDGETVYATNSPTFIRDFERIRGLMESLDTVPHHVRIERGTSKNGRNFISCVYVD